MVQEKRHIDEVHGIQFPMDANGQRSTTELGKKIVAAALAPLSEAASQAALDDPLWRKNYPQHIYALVEKGLAGAAPAVASAQAGLAAAWENFQWVKPGVVDQSLSAARSDARSLDRSNSGSRAGESGSIVTETMHGKGDTRPRPWAVPYKGRPLSGDSLKRQLADWQKRGIIEPSAAQALLACMAHPDWFDLSDRRLLLLGAASEAGPLNWLSRWRAHIIAVDRNRPEVWQKIMRTAEPGNSTIYMPKLGDHLGLDLLTQTPEIAHWLKSFEGALDLASLAYLDGERHVRVSMAMDWLAQDVLAAHPDSSLAYMATPTDVFAVAPEAAVETRHAFNRRPSKSRLAQQLLRLGGGKKFFRHNIDIPEHASFDSFDAGLAQRKSYGITDCLILEQGPNYALAKRLQQWRATVARAQGRRVSLNVAPSTNTTSVVKNTAIKMGFAGADVFGIEVFAPETTNAICAALWVYDLRNPSSPSNPARTLDHPFDLFIENASHGGMWRCVYRPRTALVFAAGLGWVRQRFGMR